MATNNRHVVFYLTVSLPLAPKRASPKGLEYWDWEELIPAEHDCHLLLESLVRFWYSVVPGYRDSLDIRWSQVTRPGHRELKVELISTDGAQQDALPDPHHNVQVVLANGTRELFRLVSAYTQIRVDEDRDKPIVLGNPKPGDTSAIYSQDTAAVTAAQEILMADARQDSERPALKGMLANGQSIDIPASLGKFSYLEPSGRKTVEGYFDELSDSRGQGLLRPTNAKENYLIKIPRSLRNGTAAAYFRKTRVRATLAKKAYSIAGLRKDSGYELIDFRVTDDFHAQQSNFHESGKTLDLFHAERRAAKTNTRKDPERRISADPPKP